MHNLALIIFWIAALLLFYAHFGYPMIMASLATLFAKEEPEPIAVQWKCSVILCVCNEERRIESRIDNLCQLTWPSDWELILVCDGCTDQTATLAQKRLPMANVIALPNQVGKAAALNEGAKAATFDILVFCDVRQSFSKNAIIELTNPFINDTIGAVSGALQIKGSDEGAGKGIDTYWHLEKRLRKWEGKFDSVVGCTGAIYAIRRHLYIPIPEDTLLDDVVIPMNIISAGRRVYFAPNAKAFDPQKLSPDKEMQRKLRTLAGNYQMLLRYPVWIMPWSGRIWWQVISHKYLRLAVPALLLLTLISSMLLMSSFFYAVCTAAQLVLYTLGAFGILRPQLRSHFFSLPAGFLLLQIANTKAFCWAITDGKDYSSLWKTDATTQPQLLNK